MYLTNERRAIEYRVLKRRVWEYRHHRKCRDHAYHIRHDDMVSGEPTTPNIHHGKRVDRVPRRVQYVFHSWGLDGECGHTKFERSSGDDSQRSWNIRIECVEYIHGYFAERPITIFGEHLEYIRQWVRTLWTQRVKYHQWNAFE